MVIKDKEEKKPKNQTTSTKNQFDVLDTKSEQTLETDTKVNSGITGSPFESLISVKKGNLCDLQQMQMHLRSRIF